MRYADIRDDADIRPCDARQAGHLAEIADAHLKDCHLVFFADAKYCEGEPDFIIEVPLGFQDRIFLREDRGNHLFRTGLSHTAGDAYDFDVQGAAVVFRKVFERLLAGLHPDVGVGNVAQVLFGQRAERTLFHDLRDEGVAVHAGALYGDEEVVLFHLPAVDNDAGYFPGSGGGVSVINAAACSGNLL